MVSMEAARQGAVRDLGLDPAEFSVESPEVQAAALRQAGSYLCPTTPRRLIATVVGTLGPLASDSALAELDELLDEMTACGDFVEAKASDQASDSLELYLGPPGFVLRRSGDAIVMGIRPDAQPLLGEQLNDRIEPLGHIRRLRPLPSQSLRPQFVDYGLLEHEMRAWIKSPVVVSAADYVRAAERKLQERVSGDVPGILLLDPTTPVGYYKGRWRSPTRRDSGRFVARRPRQYGADLWCFVDLEQGITARLLDLPADGLGRGCDEAWRLQAAIDAVRGVPQHLRVSTIAGDSSLLAFSSPIPMWQQRRLSLIGDPTTATRALFAYAVPTREVEEEVESLRTMLWMEVEGEW